MGGAIDTNWRQCCRLCLKDGRLLLPIFEGEGFTRDIAHKIQESLKTMVYVEDPLSKVVCCKCMYWVEKIYDFLELVLNGQKEVVHHLLRTEYDNPDVEQYLKLLERQEEYETRFRALTKSEIKGTLESNKRVPEIAGSGNVFETVYYNTYTGSTCLPQLKGGNFSQNSEDSAAGTTSAKTSVTRDIRSKTLPYPKLVPKRKISYMNAPTVVLGGNEPVSTSETVYRSVPGLSREVKQELLEFSGIRSESPHPKEEKSASIQDVSSPEPVEDRGFSNPSSPELEEVEMASHVDTSSAPELMGEEKFSNAVILSSSNPVIEVSSNPIVPSTNETAINSAPVTEAKEMESNSELPSASEIAAKKVECNSGMPSALDPSAEELTTNPGLPSAPETLEKKIELNPVIPSALKLVTEENVSNSDSQSEPELTTEQRASKPDTSSAPESVADGNTRLISISDKTVDESAPNFSTPSTLEPLEKKITSSLGSPKDFLSAPITDPVQEKLGNALESVSEPLEDVLTSEPEKLDDVILASASAQLEQETLPSVPEDFSEQMLGSPSQSLEDDMLNSVPEPLEDAMLTSVLEPLDEEMPDATDIPASPSTPCDEDPFEEGYLPISEELAPDIPPSEPMDEDEPFPSQEPMVEEHSFSTGPSDMKLATSCQDLPSTPKILEEKNVSPDLVTRLLEPELSVTASGTSELTPSIQISKSDSQSVASLTSPSLRAGPGPASRTRPPGYLVNKSMNLIESSDHSVEPSTPEHPHEPIEFQSTSELEMSRPSISGLSQVSASKVLGSPWACEYCNKIFKSQETLTKHQTYFCLNKRTCNRCGGSFGNDMELASHQLCHLQVCLDLPEERLHPCLQCDKKFAARTMLLMHQKTHKTLQQVEKASVSEVEKVFPCPHCPKLFAKRSILEIHLQSQHKQDEIFTARSLATTRKVDEDKSEMKEDDDESKPVGKLRSCKYCGYVCSEIELWQHMLTSHSSNMAYRCNKCGKEFAQQQAYFAHQKTVCVKVRCKVCLKLYSSTKALQEHERNKHGVSRSMHMCRICNERFITRQALDIHCRVQHAAKKETERPSSSASKSTSGSNIKYESSPSQGSGKEGGFKCNICFRNFQNEQTLQRHIKVHASGKHTFYPCEVCGKKLLSLNSYNTHVATHSVSQSFHCAQCNRIFFKEDVYHSHPCEADNKEECQTCGLMLTDEQLTSHACGEKIVPCTLCPETFCSFKALNNHMRKHKRQGAVIPAEPKPASTITRLENGMYKCNLCEKEMSTQQGAATHSRWHSGSIAQRTFKCPFCNRKYSSEKVLYGHISTEHPDTS